MGEDSRYRQPLRNRTRGCLGLHDPLTGIAGALEPDIADHLPVRRHLVEHFGDVVAAGPQRAAAARAGGGRGMDDGFPEQVCRQWPADRDCLFGSHIGSR